ncbi:twin-arginine translocase TatA/TatE family subunit [Sphingomonas gilva]|uniref:Sec-independent protein translocase protein TatA n=1 Tax=Sphingomonas gilva TaxID=2305907 RepID=A0A396RRS7_9SPHN|nr:twin-arginine translocase TatA/TatE family subunit [Sphingomonas gilva]RHW18032.1 twin-arginine translocase TatA/TatE family subunit [Sphingomonas gilva]
MGGLSIWHWLIVGIIVLLLFGKGRFSDMMGDVAKGIKSFKKGMTEEDEAAQKPAPRIEAQEAARPASETVITPVAEEQKTPR